MHCDVKLQILWNNLRMCLITWKLKSYPQRRMPRTVGCRGRLGMSKIPYDECQGLVFCVCVNEHSLILRECALSSDPLTTLFVASRHFNMPDKSQRSSDGQFTRSKCYRRELSQSTQCRGVLVKMQPICKRAVAWFNIADDDYCKNCQDSNTLQQVLESSDNNQHSVW